MNDIQIIPATDSDKQWAAELMASSEPWVTLGRTLETCKANTFDPISHVFVAWRDQQRCGMIILHDRGVAGSPYVKSIAIAPEFRSHGIGEQLLQFAEEHYRNNSRHLFLCVSSFNMRAQQFYSVHGWEVIGEFKDYVIEGASEILMYKRLR